VRNFGAASVDLSRGLWRPRRRLYHKTTVLADLRTHSPMLISWWMFVFGIISPARVHCGGTAEISQDLTSFHDSHVMACEESHGNGASRALAFLKTKILGVQMARDCWTHGFDHRLIGQDNRDSNGQGAEFAKAEFSYGAKCSQYDRPQQHAGEMARQVGARNPEHGSGRDQAYRNEEIRAEQKRLQPLAIAREPGCPRGQRDEAEKQRRQVAANGKNDKNTRKRGY
jgi:hypothetical protein